MALKARNMISEDDPRVSKVGHPSPPWMSSYADLMTEMVCFFVILYAMSAALNKKMITSKSLIEEAMRKEQVKVEVKVVRDGMTITLQEQGQHVFFESGRAELAPDFIAVMDKIAVPLLGLSEKHEILVEGHTDNVPVRQGSAYPSNWELSTARATNVVRYLVSQKDFKPQRVSAVGYGEYRPVASNDAPENRSKNRRVVFFVKNNAPSGAEKAKK